MWYSLKSSTIFNDCWFHWKTKKKCAINEFKQKQEVWCAQWRDYMHIHTYLNNKSPVAVTPKWPMTRQGTTGNGWMAAVARVKQPGSWVPGGGSQREAAWVPGSRWAGGAAGGWVWLGGCPEVGMGGVVSTMRCTRVGRVVQFCTLGF